MLFASHWKQSTRTAEKQQQKQYERENGRLFGTVISVQVALDKIKQQQLKDDGKEKTKRQKKVNVELLSSATKQKHNGKSRYLSSNF